jgi:hypothetical protein
VKTYSLSRLAIFISLIFASAQPALATSFEEMRHRDRRNKPDTELAAWTAFAAPALHDVKTPAVLRAEIHMRLAIALYHAKDYPKGWVEAQAAEKLITPRAPFAPELAAYQSLLLTDLNRLDEAKVYGEKALALVRAGAGEESGAIALPYNSLAMLDYAKGDYLEAARLMCLSSDRAQKYLLPTDSMVASSMMACGIFRYNLDDDDAWEIMRQAATFA